MDRWRDLGFNSPEELDEWVKKVNEENRRRHLSGEPDEYTKQKIYAQKHTYCGDCGSWNVYVNIPPCQAISQCQDCHSCNMAWDDKGRE